MNLDRSVKFDFDIVARFACLVFKELKDGLNLKQSIRTVKYPKKPYMEKSTVFQLKPLDSKEIQSNNFLNF